MCAVRSEFVAGEGMRWVGFLYRVEGAVGKVGDARGEDWVYVIQSRSEGSY